MNYPPNLIIRHRKENKKKCSLQPILGRKDCLFFNYPNTKLPSLDHYVLLDLKGPILSSEDRGKGLVIVDATWKYASKMNQQLSDLAVLEKRSLPSTFKTAYPRRQLDCLDGKRGLASIEALYIAYLLLSRNTTGLLEDYYWKNLFLELNPDLQRLIRD